jgi:beta-N-acetylhexosaminidase
MIQVPRSLAAAEEADLIRQCADYDRIIIGFHRTNNNPKRNFGITRQSVLIHNLLSGNHEVITVLFGNPYAIESFGDLKDTEGFVVAYQDNENTNAAAAQLIYGGITAEGRLPVSGSEHFPSDLGIRIDERIRLAHVLPEEIGLSSQILAGIDKICDRSIKLRAFPGCQVVAIKNGNVIYNKAFGYHTYDKTQTVKTDDIYDLASITKIAATTVSLIKLTKEGKFDMDHKLTTYLPEYVDSTRYEKMKIRQMLAHQAGLHPWIPFYTKTLLNGNPNPDIYATDSSTGLERVAAGMYIDSEYDTLMLKRIVMKPLRSRTYKYSDLGYYFIKAIIEKQSGQALDEYVMENFYRPMGLSSMGYHPLYRHSKERIPPTENDTIFRKQIVHGDVHDPGAAMQGGVGGHAGLFSSALDLGTMMYMLINDGNYGGRNYLDRDTIADFTKCQYCPRNRRGAGFDKPVRSLQGGPTCDQVSLSSFGHQGFTGAITWADPENGIVYVFLSNRVYPNAENWLIVSENVRTEIQNVIYKAAKGK